MIEKPVDIATRDGVVDGVLFLPDSGAAAPGVIHLTDYRGIRDSQRPMAGRLVEHGYAVLMPNVFYRTAKPPVFDFEPVMGDERTVKRFQELIAPLTPDAMERDMAACVDFLVSEPGVRKGRVGVAGYCLTGKMALHAAAVRPAQVGAAVSFHGGGLVTDTPASPHLLLPRIQAALYFGHAVEDRSMPAEAIEKLDAALMAWGGDFESEVYDARHGWTMVDHPGYDQAQADRAFTRLVALYDRCVRG